MSIKTQKFLRFVPVLNFITLFIWFHLCFTKSITMKSYMKKLVKIFIFLMGIAGVEILYLFTIERYLNDLLQTMASWVFTGFYMFAISFVAVEAQEEILQSEQINKSLDA